MFSAPTDWTNSENGLSPIVCLTTSGGSRDMSSFPRLMASNVHAYSSSWASTLFCRGVLTSGDAKCMKRVFAMKLRRLCWGLATPNFSSFEPTLNSRT